MTLPAWRAREIRIAETEPLNHLTHAHAMDLLKRTHKRLDSLRFQLWSSMREVEQLMSRLEQGQKGHQQNLFSFPPKPRIRKASTPKGE